MCAQASKHQRLAQAHAAQLEGARTTRTLLYRLDLPVAVPCSKPVNAYAYACGPGLRCIHVTSALNQPSTLYVDMHRPSRPCHLPQQASKRQRLAHAAQLEDDRTQRVAALVTRSAEALLLLRVLCAHHIGRLAARLDAQARRTLSEMVRWERRGHF